MCECKCHENYTLDTLIPKVGVITDIREETPDVKTFRVNAPEGGKLFEHMPGQCAMLCAPGVSEGMFSITSSPTNKEYQEFSIKKCGVLTDYLHSLEVGDEITVRGPYGNYFPVETELKGKNLLFIAGGNCTCAASFCDQLCIGQSRKLRNCGYCRRFSICRRSCTTERDSGSMDA